MKGVVILILILGFFPTPKTLASDIAASQTEVFTSYGELNPSTLTFATAEPPTLNLVVSDTSPYLEEQKRLENERREALRKQAAQRAATVANRTPVARGTVNLTASSGAVKLYVDHTNNCVTFAKRKTGISGTLGNGARGAIQGYEPRVGAIVALKGNIHAAVVVQVKGGTIVVQESNWIKGWITQRELPMSSAIGYVYF